MSKTKTLEVNNGLLEHYTSNMIKFTFIIGSTVDYFIPKEKGVYRKKGVVVRRLDYVSCNDCVMEFEIDNGDIIKFIQIL